VSGSRPADDPPVLDAIGPTLPTARTDTPKPVWTVRGLPALPGMVALWFAPKTTGASLAGSGWLAAVAAHLLSLTAGGGLILWTVHLKFTWYGEGANVWDLDVGWSEYLRAPFAAFATVIHAAGTSGLGIVVLPLAFAGIEAVVVLLALAMMPFAAAGERAGRLFGRCLRLSWWGSTSLIPMGALWLLVPVMQDTTPAPAAMVSPNVKQGLGVAALGLCSVWWLVVLLRSGYRYAGPPEGPAWTPRQPRCEQCGYPLVGLSRETNCPECGRPVVQSLPERRTGRSFATARKLGGSVMALCRTVWATAAGKTFFDRLPVLRGHARARTFLLVTSALNAVLVFLVFGAGQIASAEDRPVGDAPANAAWMASAAFLIQVLLVGWIAALGSALARRPVQVAAVTTFYAFGPLAMVPIGAGIVVCAMALGDSVLDAPGRNLVLTGAWAVFAALGVACIVLGLWRIVRNLGAGFRRTRFANA